MTTPIIADDDVLAILFKHGYSFETDHGVFKKLSELMNDAATIERAACAELVQKNAEACDPGSMLQIYLASNAAAIRARGQS